MVEGREKNPRRTFFALQTIICCNHTKLQHEFPCSRCCSVRERCDDDDGGGVCARRWIRTPTMFSNMKKFME